MFGSLFSPYVPSIPTMVWSDPFSHVSTTSNTYTALVPAKDWYEQMRDYCIEKAIDESKSWQDAAERYSVLIQKLEDEEEECECAEGECEAEDDTDWEMVVKWTGTDAEGNVTSGVERYSFEPKEKNEEQSD